MRFNRTTAWFTSLAYLVASALSLLLHSHPHDVSQLNASACHTHCDRGAADPHACEQQGHDDDHSSPKPASDDDCLACRFVAQSATVSLPPPEPGRLPLVAELRSSPPRVVVQPPHSSALARAPPIG
jgi:hypothetical protein